MLRSNTNNCTLILIFDLTPNKANMFMCAASGFVLVCKVCSLDSEDLLYMLTTNYASRCFHRITGVVGVLAYMFE